MTEYRRSRRWTATPTRFSTGRKLFIYSIIYIYHFFFELLYLPTQKHNVDDEDDRAEPAAVSDEPIGVVADAAEAEAQQWVGDNAADDLKKFAC